MSFTEVLARGIVGAGIACTFACIWIAGFMVWEHARHKGRHRTLAACEARCFTNSRGPG